MVFRCKGHQVRMRSPLFGLQICVFAWSFLKVFATCLRRPNALARQCFSAGSSEPLLVAYVISTLFAVLSHLMHSMLVKTSADDILIFCGVGWGMGWEVAVFIFYFFIFFIYFFFFFFFVLFNFFFFFFFFSEKKSCWHSRQFAPTDLLRRQFTWNVKAYLHSSIQNSYDWRIIFNKLV